MGTRPRLACEVRAEGVVAARAEDASAVLAAVSRAPLGEGGDSSCARKRMQGGNGGRRMR